MASWTKLCHGWDTDMLAFQAEWLAVLGKGIWAQVSVRSQSMLPIQTWAGGEGQVQLALHKSQPDGPFI